MTSVLEKPSAATVRTRYLETGGRKLAYRRFGEGPPLLMCLRFRGVMDSWDPAFLDALARRFDVIVFDYGGLGLSTGAFTYRRRALADDAREVADGLSLERVVMLGWSLGGMAAQVFTAVYPERTTHGIYIGTTPPGEQPYPPEPIFLPTAMKPVNTLEDEYILFFEPASDASRAAAKATHDRIALRTVDRSPPIAEETFLRLLAEGSTDKALFTDDGGYAERLANTSIPLLSINGDHDVVFPVENWYALNRRWKSLSVVTFPQAGHGPQHQYPEISADLIASFVRNT